MEEVAANAVTTAAALKSGILSIGAALAVGLSALGTGLAQSKIGAAGAGAIAEKPEVSGLIIILLAIPETVVILGFVVACMIILML
jgi:V/A-type H+-transporting ATPase subunit K